MRNTVEIINQQIVKWEAQRRMVKVKGLFLERHQPVITVSSAHGAQGEQIGQLVAKALKFDFFDRQLVDLVASSAKVRHQVAASLDEKLQDLITEYITFQFSTQNFTNSDFLRHLCRVVLTIGHHGQAVIIGRGAQFILDPQHTLTVRIIAPLELRIARIADQYSLTIEDARTMVLNKDMTRMAFCQKHFNRSVSDPQHYNLVLNALYLQPDQIAELIIKAFNQRFASIHDSP